MKTILNKIGAVSKPVIFGAALGVATVAVGIGVATNLMSDGPKGVSGRVLGQYSADSASVGSGGGYDAFSKEALEQQMAAAQAAREGGTALDYLGAAGRNRFAYGDNAGSYEGGVVDPMAMNNAAYEGVESGANAGMPSDVKAAMNQFNATAAAVSSQAGKGGTEEYGTRLNKLSRSNMSGGASASGGFGGGGSHNMGAIMGAAAASDKAALQTVPSVNMGDRPEGNISGVAGAKHGRLGAMGGNNARGGFGGGGGSGQAYFTSTIGELVSAQKYSALGKGTVYGDAEKGFVEASAAFDGSGDAGEGVQITGSTPMIDKAAALDREATKINNKNNTGGIDTNVTPDVESFSKARKELMLATIAMLGTMLAIATAISFIKGTDVWSWIAKAALLAAGIVAVWAIYGAWMLKNIQLLQDNSQYIKNGAGIWPWLAPTIAGIATAVMGIAMVGKVSEGIRNFVKNIGKNFTERIKKFASLFQAPAKPPTPPTKLV